MKILNDFTTSVEKALSEIDPKWRDYDGLIICGTHTPINTEQMIDELHDAREKKLPTLGICFGMQLMAIEYARNVLDKKDATSQEFGKGTFVVHKLPALRVGMKEVKGRNESHWHRYGIGVDWAFEFKNAWDVVFNEVVEEMYLKGHPHYVGVQYHPEYQSSKDKPHPLLVEFINTCKN